MENYCIPTFFNGMSAMGKCKLLSPGFERESPFSFLTIVALTPRVSLCGFIYSYLLRLSFVWHKATSAEDQEITELITH